MALKIYVYLYGLFPETFVPNCCISSCSSLILNLCTCEANINMNLILARTMQRCFYVRSDLLYGLCSIHQGQACCVCVSTFSNGFSLNGICVFDDVVIQHLPVIWTPDAPIVLQCRGPGLSRWTTPKSTKVRGTYECERCNKKFTWMAALQQHENNKHGRRPHPFLCQICSKGFWNQRDLRGHLASKHRMQKDFQCLICGREYSYKTYLKVHMRTCHGIGCWWISTASSDAIHANQSCLPIHTVMSYHL